MKNETNERKRRMNKSGIDKKQRKRINRPMMERATRFFTHIHTYILVYRQKTIYFFYNVKSASMKIRITIVMALMEKMVKYLGHKKLVHNLLRSNVIFAYFKPINQFPINTYIDAFWIDVKRDIYIYWLHLVTNLSIMSPISRYCLL